MDFFLGQFEPAFLTMRFEIAGSAGLLIEWLGRSVTQYIFVFVWTNSEREAIIFPGLVWIGMLKYFQIVS